jgi:hypothetical protein
MNFVLYLANTSIMKKFLLWLPAVIVIGAAMSQPVKEALTGKPVDKSISIAVYKGTTYASDIYNNTSAQLHVTIEKVKDGHRTQVWNKTFDARLLKQYPSPGQAILQTVTVPKVFCKEHLEVIYTVTYNSGGSQLQMQSVAVVPGNVTTDKLDISI